MIRRLAAILLLAAGVASAQTTYTPNLHIPLPPVGSVNWAQSYYTGMLTIDSSIGGLQNTYKGAWSSVTSYLLGQFVTYGGVTYIAAVNNINHTPGTDSTWVNLGVGGLPAPGASGCAPVSNGTSYLCTAVVLQSAVAAANGVAPLNSASQVPAANLTPCGASGGAHSAGIVPDPGSSAGTTRYLREDCTWVANGAAFGNANQLAYYPSNGTALAGTNALPNGTTATTQSPGDTTTKVANMAALAAAVAADGAVLLSPSAAQAMVNPFAMGSNNGYFSTVLPLISSRTYWTPNYSGTLNSTPISTLANPANTFYSPFVRLQNASAPGFYHELGSGSPAGQTGATYSYSGFGEAEATINQQGANFQSEFRTFHPGAGRTEGGSGLFGYGGGTGEGDKGWTWNVQETTSTYAGSVVTGGSGATQLKLTCTADCLNPGDGRYLLDTQSNAGTGYVTATTAPSGLTPGTFTIAGGTVTASSAWGTLASNVTTPLGNPVGTGYTSETFNVNLLSGTFSVGNLVCMSGQFHEQSIISAVGTPSGGVQSITVPLRQPQQSGSWIMAGGPCGEFIDFTANHSSGLTWPFDIIGATGSSTLVYDWFAGSPTTLAAWHPGNVVLNQVNVTSLSNTGGTLTMTLTANTIQNYPYFNGAAQITISGSAGSSLFNGSCTSATWTASTNVLTCTQAASSGLTTTGATIAFGDTAYGNGDFTLYNGAEVLDVQNESPTNAPVGTASASGGSLSGAWYARVVALNSSGNIIQSTAESAAVPVTGSSGSISWACTTVSGATTYQVYTGQVSGQENSYISGSSCPLTQTAAVGTLGNYSLIDGSLTLEPNKAVWATNDAVVQPHHYIEDRKGIEIHTTTNSPAPSSYTANGGIDTYDIADGAGAVGDPTQPFASTIPGVSGFDHITTNTNALGTYTYSGGAQNPEGGYLLNGPHQDGFSMQYAPWLGYHGVINVGCPVTGCTDPNQTYTVLDLVANGGFGRMTFNPYTNTFAYTSPISSVNVQNLTLFPSGGYSAEQDVKYYNTSGSLSNLFSYNAASSAAWVFTPAVTFNGRIVGINGFAFGVGGQAAIQGDTFNETQIGPASSNHSSQIVYCPNDVSSSVTPCVDIQDGNVSPTHYFTIDAVHAATPGAFHGATGSTVNSSLICTAAGAGGGDCNSGTPGTVTSVTSGNAAPLFTVAVATNTTTPAFTYTLSNAAAYTFFCNGTSGSAAPTYCSASTALAALGSGTAPTGTGALVLVNTPTLVTPVLGVASATSINKVIFTAPATAATLTLANNSTFTTSGAFSWQFTVPGAYTYTLPSATSTLLATNGSGSSLTFGTGTLSLAGNLTTTGAFNPTLAFPAANTYTFPNTASSTLVDTTATQTITGKSIAGSEINSSTVGATYGGTGLNTSASTGVATVASGTWSVTNGASGCSQTATGLDGCNVPIATHTGVVGLTAVLTVPASPTLGTNYCMAATATTTVAGTGAGTLGIAAYFTQPSGTVRNPSIGQAIDLTTVGATSSGGLGNAGILCFTAQASSIIYYNTAIASGSTTGYTYSAGVELRTNGP